MRRFTSLLLIGLFVLNACTTKKIVKVDRARVDLARPRQDIVGVTTTDGKDIRFDPGSPLDFRPASGNQPISINPRVGGKSIQIPIFTIERVWTEIEEGSKSRTIALVAGIGGAAALTAILISRGKSDSSSPAPAPTPRVRGTSCPFIYSWNGTQYVFDAEPYGGATTRGLERTDISELENIKEVRGEYRVLMTNEQDETEYANLVELEVVDHPHGTRVVPDESGTFRTISDPQPPIRATDRSGKDVRQWLNSRDRLIWEPLPVADSRGTLRDEIELTFRKPAGARQAKLVVNAGTGMWGSMMIKTFMELYGRDLPLRYKELDTNALAVDMLSTWAEREDLFALKVLINEQGEWAPAGVLFGGGPYSIEDRVIPIDLSQTSGDEVRLKIRPPLGFWAFNYFAMDFTPDLPVRSQTVSAFEARDQNGQDVRGRLARADARYYEMPNIGDQTVLRFRAPAERSDVDRTVFLRSRGYYRLHLDANGNPQTALLDEIENVADAAARLSSDRFAAFER